MDDGEPGHTPLRDRNRMYKEGSVRLTQALIAAISATRQTARLSTTGRPRQSWASALLDA